MALPTGNNIWCGPWAVAAITGVSTDAVADLVRQRRAARRRDNGLPPRLPKRQAEVKSTNASELQYALRRLGWRAFAEQFAGTWCRLLRRRIARPTLGQWVGLHAADGTIALVLAGSHWVVVTGGIVGCRVAGDFVPVAQHEYRRKRVRWSVFVMRK